MYARRPKESHLDTIAYEIEMLEFAAAELSKRSPTDERVTFLMLEGFLLHYRNLVRVFSGECARADDVSTANPTTWAHGEVPAEEVRTIRKSGKALDDKWFRLISKYLQHCTTARHETDQSWDVEAMLDELRPTLASFKAAFLKRCR